MDAPHLLTRSLLQAVENAAGLAAKGIPAIRAALYGARLGAGAKLDAAVIERLGVRVVRSLRAAPAVATDTVAQAATASARALAIETRDGLSLGVGGARLGQATVTDSAIAAARGLTVRGALVGLGRAASHGAAVGALVDGAIGAVEAGLAVSRGRLTRGEALAFAGKRAARGAASGAAGVAAAGAASALVAAAGISVAGAPFVVPLVAMVAVGTVVSRKVDGVLGTAEPASEWRLPNPSSR
ncbi:MAG: hypothetical protein U0271_00795 [Polyangiaceae bacterium]